MTLDVFELIEVFTFVLGGSGWGLSITFEPGLLNFDAGLLDELSGETGLPGTWVPGREFFPETIIIDLCPDVEACASTISVADRPAVVGPEEPCWL